ncbi:hypothetical protein VY88_08705 [Azospirillum thiophilum]|uniref:Uncharacterized protein n=1 Tax=Azospirillum thiophilum TaxID=528244 RepID=A0AAC8VVK9_9PROT|nr:hypothetical protein [Azospirillum thiophilum]ALG70215.1 hypothetical protein AL072_04000 [Azospirillum thiophilum]KJR66106.1 hypothetical protein VY88_08705 [Azospirillum thiophilum]
MLHIKDIEAFARINEALNENGNGNGGADAAGTAGPDEAAGGGGPTHPALVLAMLATGRLPLSALSKTAAPDTDAPDSAAPAKPEMPAPWGRLFRRP